jgi:hypothetical protein
MEGCSIESKHGEVWVPAKLPLPLNPLLATLEGDLRAEAEGLRRVVKV